MRDIIVFLKPVLLKSALTEALLDVRFSGDKMQATNGAVVAERPYKTKDAFSLPGEKFIKAISACQFDPEIKETETRVHFYKDQFRAMIPKTNAGWITIDHHKMKKVAFEDDLLEKLTILFPFISEDASRLWSQAIMAKDGYLYVTNNIMAVRIKCEISKTILFSADLVRAIIGYGQKIKTIRITKRHIIIDYGKGIKYTTSLMTEKWPSIEKMFPKKFKTKLIPEDFILAVNLIKPFAEEDIVKIQDKKLVTDYGSYSGIKLPDTSFSCFNMLLALKFFNRMNLKHNPILFEERETKIQGLMAKANA